MFFTAEKSKLSLRSKFWKPERHKGIRYYPNKNLIDRRLF